MEISFFAEKKSFLYEKINIKIILQFKGEMSTIKRLLPLTLSFSMVAFGCGKENSRPPTPSAPKKNNKPVPVVNECTNPVTTNFGVFIDNPEPENDVLMLGSGPNSSLQGQLIVNKSGSPEEQKARLKKWCTIDPMP